MAFICNIETNSINWRFAERDNRTGHKTFKNNYKPKTKTNATSLFNCYIYALHQHLIAVRFKDAGSNPLIG
jgi:hypothetical protein